MKRTITNKPDTKSATPSSDLYTNDQGAAYLGIMPNTLNIWRSTKRYNIPFVRVGRLIRYRKSDLDAFLNQRTVGADNAEAA